MADKALVDRIVAAEGFGEPARKWLEQLGDDQLEPIAAHCAPEKPAGDPDPSASKGADLNPDPEKPKPDPNPKPDPKPDPPKSEEEVLAMLPPERREMFAEMQARWDDEVDGIRKEIIANSRGVFTETDLKGKSRKELEKIHALAKPAPNYEGRGATAHDGSAGKQEPKVMRMPGIAIGKAS